MPGESGTDPGDIIEIYTAFSKKYNIMMDRDAWQWEKALEYDPVQSKIRTYIIYDDKGTSRAYFTYAYNREGFGTDLSLKDIAWADTEGMYMLFGFLGRLAGNVKKIKFHIPPEMTVSYLWQEPKKYEIFYEPSGMARVINAKKALEIIKKPKTDGSFTIKIEDTFMAQNNKSYKVSWKNGKSEAAEFQGECDIECPATALAQIVTGFVSLDLAESRRDVKINGNKETLLKFSKRK